MKFSNGLPLLRLPVTARNRGDERRRDIQEPGSLTASRALEQTGVEQDGPMVCVGSKNRFAALLRGYVNRSTRPFVYIGTEEDMNSGCILALEPAWTIKDIRSRLPGGCGAVTLDPGKQDTHLSLLEALPGWRDHLVILCLGSGIQADQSMLDQLNTLGNYVLLCESLGRSVRGTEGSRLTPGELLRAMDYLVISSAGLSSAELMEVLPTYESERITNTFDLSTHRAASRPLLGRRYDYDRGGLGMSQSRTLETKPIITQDELRDMQRTGQLLIHNSRTAVTWKVKIR